MRKILLGLLLALTVLVSARAGASPGRYTMYLPLFAHRPIPYHLNLGFAGVALDGSQYSLTGGSRGKTVVVDNASDFKKAIDQPVVPLTIQVSGEIDLGGGMHPVSSNKTIEGVNEKSRLVNGGLRLYGVENVIIKNLSFYNSPDDLIQIKKCAHWRQDCPAHNILIIHNHFQQAADELLAITKQSTNVTICWNVFEGLTETSGRQLKSILVGASGSDTADRGYLNTTICNNWFRGTLSRHPLGRFGKFHIFGNYFQENKVGVTPIAEAQMVVENNYFEDDVLKPIGRWGGEGKPGYWLAEDNNIQLESRLPSREPASDFFTHSRVYGYTVFPAQDIPKIVQYRAGPFGADRSKSWVR